MTPPDPKIISTQLPVRDQTRTPDRTGAVILFDRVQVHLPRGSLRCVTILFGGGGGGGGFCFGSR